MNTRFAISAELADYNFHNCRKIEEVIIDSSPLSFDGISEWHRRDGYADVGYHFVIDLDGTIHQGRELATQGMHCLNHNEATVGICYTCNPYPLTEDTRTEMQKASLTWLIGKLCTHLPIRKISGTWNYLKTENPGFSPSEEYQHLIKDDQR